MTPGSASTAVVAMHDPDAIETVMRYHERTKHRFDRYAPGPGELDWANQPSPFRPSFEMSMARKDLRLMVEEAARGGQTLTMIPRWRRCWMTASRAGKVGWTWRPRCACRVKGAEASTPLPWTYL